MKTVLMIAYHYPPEGSSSGVQRTLKFSQYLPEYGWDPIVVSAHPRAYRVARTEQLQEIPERVVVRRAFALDSARHLSVGGRYIALTALPDRWASWWLGALSSVIPLLRKYRPAVLWSTFPIATAHLIGLTLRRLTGLPWVADFRDSMTEDTYPPDPRQRRVYRWIERRTLLNSERAVFTAPGAVRMYAERYPELESGRLVVIPNGYDEENFATVGTPRPCDTTGCTPVVLLHSGELYPSERDPRAFYDAIAMLLAEGRVSPDGLRVVLRATNHDDYHQRLIDERGISDIVVVEHAIPYHRALREMMEADGLLVFQAANCNHQIPAKIYEYMRAGRPIMALTDLRGDTASALREAGFDTIVPLDDRDRIAKALVRFVSDVRSGAAKTCRQTEVIRHSRKARTEALAAVFDRVAERVASGE